MTDRPSTRYVFVPATALALLVMLGGCTNPFTPANPEPPTAGAPVEDFSSIEAMLTTMAIGIQTRSQAGADAYIHCFAESTTTGERAFYAYHDPTAKAAWIQGHPGQAAPEPWPLALERRLHSELSTIRQNDDYVFTMGTNPISGPLDAEIAPDVWSIHRYYKLYATPANSDPVLIVSGYADLLVQQVNSKWSIFEWRDRVDPDYGANSVDVRCFTYHRLSAP